MGAQALFLPIRRRLKKKEKSVVYKSTWYDLVRSMQAPNRLGDVGEARWPLSHRWTDTSPTLPDAAYDTRNQGRVVSHSELSLLSACVRLCQLREARGSSQVAAIAESLVTDAVRSNRRVTCLLHIISDGTRVRHAQGITLSILRAFIACAATVQTSLHLAETLRPTALPHDSAFHL